MRGLKFVSLHGRNGYGEAASRYMSGLADAGVPFAWAPMVPRRRLRRGYEAYEGTRIGSPLDAFCNRRVEYDTVLIHAMPEYYAQWAAREKGKRLVGYAAWETDTPPAHWPALLNALDLLLVPCEWNRDVFREHGVSTRIEVVPHATLACEALAETSAEHYGARPGDFCFYTIGEWTSRKAIWRTIDAYLRAFTADDPVTLLVKTTSRDGTRGALGGSLLGTRRTLDRILRGYPRPARVVLLTGSLDDAELLRLHAAGHCYVSLARGEGWGLGAFDAASFGRPVIMTGFGGQVDWLGADYPLFVDHRMIPVDDPRARASYSEDQRWAEADLDHAAQLMRDALDPGGVTASVRLSLRDRVRQRYNQAVVTRRLLEALS